MSSPEPQPVSDPAAHLRLVLWRANKAVENVEVAHLQARGLCLSDFAILEVLLHKGALPVNTIGQKVLLTSGSITTAISRLEKRGLVQRKPGQEDRRVIQVHLTPEGMEFISHHYARHLECLNRIAGVLEDGERDDLVRLLKKLGLHAAGLDRVSRPPDQAIVSSILGVTSYRPASPLA